MMKPLRDHEKAVLSAAMFEEGVLPIDDTYHDMRRALDQLPADEARKIKRRFRKVWRKLARQEAEEHSRVNVAGQQSWLKNRYGTGKNNPSRTDREARKRLVQEAFYKNVVRPILDKFESAKKPDQKECMCGSAGCSTDACKAEAKARQERIWSQDRDVNDFV